MRGGESGREAVREIEAADLHTLDVEEVGTVLEVKDGIARVYGLGKAMAGEMLEFKSKETGDVITGLALNLEEDNIGAVILGDYLVLKEGDEVRRTSRVLEAAEVGAGEAGPVAVTQLVMMLGAIPGPNQRREPAQRFVRVRWAAAGTDERPVSSAPGRNQAAIHAFSAQVIVELRGD